MRPDYVASPNDNVIIEGIAGQPDLAGLRGLRLLRREPGPGQGPGHRRRRRLRRPDHGDHRRRHLPLLPPAVHLREHRLRPSGPRWRPSWTSTSPSDGLATVDDTGYVRARRLRPDSVRPGRTGSPGRPRALLPRGAPPTGRGAGPPAPRPPAPPSGTRHRQTPRGLLETDHDVTTEAPTPTIDLSGSRPRLRRERRVRLALRWRRDHLDPDQPASSSVSLAGEAWSFLRHVDLSPPLGPGLVPPPGHVRPQDRAGRHPAHRR